MGKKGRHQPVKTEQIWELKGKQKRVAGEAECWLEAKETRGFQLSFSGLKLQFLIGENI